MTARVWHTGPPPHVGWWNASVTRGEYLWRWWHGKCWSTCVCADDSTGEMQRCASIQMPESHVVEWSYYWPENARVPRINPETGEVTGGKK